MSKWIEIDAKDIDFTDDSIDIRVTEDHNGTVYASISYSTILKILSATDRSK